MRNKKHFFNIFLFIFNCIYVTSSTTTTYTFDQIETTNNEYNNNNSPLPLPTSHSMIIKEQQEEKQFNLIDNNNDYISDTNTNNNNEVEMFRDIPASTLFIYKQNDQNEKTTTSKFLLKNILEEEKKDVKIEEVEIGEEDVNGDGVIIQMIKDNDNNNNENEDRDVEINSEDAELSLSSSQVNVKWIKLSELTDIVDYVINTNDQDNKVIWNSFY
jgi:hypothetical protein